MDLIHKIRSDIDTFFKGINLKLDKAHQKATDLHYFTEVQNLFDRFKIYKDWKNDEKNMELLNAPCQCNTCVKNLHKIEWYLRDIKLTSEKNYKKENTYID